MRVVILFERNAQPDEHVAKILESGLAAEGLDVFLDRNPGDDVEWAREMKNRVRSAAGVVALLSASSVTSEMTAYQIRFAYDTLQAQGKPKLIPVRLNYTDPVPRGLAGILEIEHLTWMSPSDDAALVAKVLAHLDVAAPRPQTVLPHRLESVGGAVPLDSEFYIVRPADDEFTAAIDRRDSIVLVKGARQMGKTSLLARGVQKAREGGAKIVLTDFQKFNEDHLASVDAFYITLAELIADQLDLDLKPESVWSPRRGPNMNFERFLRREILGRSEGHLVWALDEVDRLFSCRFGSEVFGLFRSWHNERSLDPAGPWRKLTLAIAYATEAHLFITDMNQSPFNVGTRLALEDFTFDQVAELNRRHGSVLQKESELVRYFNLVGGHPFLVRQGLHALVTQGIGFAALEARADREDGLFGDHLRRILMSLQQDPALCDAMRAVLAGNECPTKESFYRLRSAGLVLGDSPKDVLPRCRLYASHLKRHLQS